MEIEGTLTKWNDDRGFGFITPTNGGEEIFVHISAFPKHGARPAIGERISFSIELDQNGKKRANNLLRANQGNANRPSNAYKAYKPRNNHSKKASFGFKPFLGLSILAIVAFGYNQHAHQTEQAPAASVEMPRHEFTPAYHCDGRTHCSEMTSCAEATFFLQNCPTVKMDGDNDGIPCEQQWCSLITDTGK